MICEQIKLISEDSSDFIKNLDSVQRKLEGNREEYDQQLNALKKELQENEQQIANLVDILAKTPNTPAFDYITEQINTLHEKNEKIKNRISELESLTKNHLYSSEEFDRTKELLKSFGQSFDTMSVEQKRMALRAFIRRIIWDGENVHVVLFGDTESEIDYTDLAEEKQSQSEGIANEVLMFFRNGKKSAQDVSMNEPIDTDKEGNTLTLMDVMSTEDNIVDNLDIKIKSEQLKKYLGGGADPQRKNYY